jgi:hypothetical protein
VANRLDAPPPDALAGAGAARESDAAVM